MRYLRHPAGIRRAADHAAGHRRGRRCQDRMLGDVATVEIVASLLLRQAGRTCPRSSLIPVMVATSGDVLLRPEAIDARARASLLPLADVLTPNLAEAARLLDRPLATGRRRRWKRRRGRCSRSGAKAAVLVKGGHGEGAEAVDILVAARMQRRLRLALPAHSTRATRTAPAARLSAALTAYLVRGETLIESAARRGESLRARGVASRPPAQAVGARRGSCGSSACTGGSAHKG